MDPIRLQTLLLRACWTCLGLLLLGSLTLLSVAIRFELQPGAWAASAALATFFAARALGDPRSTEDHLGGPLLALAGCGAIATLGSPPLEPVAMGMAVAWGGLLLVWHQLATVYLELRARTSVPLPAEGVALVEAAIARLRAVGRAIATVVALSLFPLLFAAFPLVGQATLGARLVLFAALVGTVAAVYLGLQWHLQRREPSRNSG